MSKTSPVLPNNDTVELVFKTLETETTALFEYLELSFLMEYPVFGPRSEGANTGSRTTGIAEGRPSLLL